MHNNEEAPIDDVTVKRENMILYLLINNPQETKDIIQSNIGIEDLKIEENKIIFEKIMSSDEKDSEKITQIIANIEDENIQTHISTIMVTDYEIKSIQKCLEDVIITYNQERLQNRKIEIVKKMENPELTKDEMANLEMELSDIITKLAIIK